MSGALVLTRLRERSLSGQAVASPHGLPSSPRAGLYDRSPNRRQPADNLSESTSVPKDGCAVFQQPHSMEGMFEHELTCHGSIFRGRANEELVCSRRSDRKKEG